MTRKNRNVSSSVVEKDDREEIFTQQQVFDWLTFAQELSGLGTLTGMPLTPQIVNTQLKNVTINNIGGITEDRVNKALADPKNNEIELLNISESFAVNSMVYRRLLDYMSNLLAWSFSTSCINAKASDYSSKAYQKDLDILKEFFYKFDVKSEFSKVVKQLFREETFFSVLRDEGDKWTLQQLPSQRCLITGRNAEANLLFSFDYSWFIQAGVDIQMYPDIFKKTYSNLILKNGGQNKYIPSLPMDERMNSSFVWMADCSPVNNFWAWKLSSEIATRVPFFSGMFPDLAMQPLIRGLQKSSLMASAVKIIIGNIPMLKDQKAKISDAFSLDATSLARFLKMLQGAINSEAVRVGAMPLEDVKALEFSSQTDLYSSFIKTTLGTSGINSNLLFSADVKPNIEETRLSVNIDEMISFGLYNYFDKFVEYHVNKKTSKFKFKIEFEGSNFYSDKERRWQLQKDAISYGIVNVSKIASALGQNPFVLQAQLEESKAMGFVEKLTPIIPAAQMSANNPNNTGTGGAPKKSDTEISESGSQTQSDGGNITKTKKQ